VEADPFEMGWSIKYFDEFYSSSSLAVVSFAGVLVYDLC